MTGRFFRGPIPWDEYGQHLDFIPPDGIEPPEPRYNIPPSSWVPVIRPRLFHKPGNEMALMLWNLVPMWWKRTAIGAVLFLPVGSSCGRALRVNASLLPSDWLTNLGFVSLAFGRHGGMTAERSTPLPF